MRFYGGYGKEGLAPGRQRPEDDTGKAVQGEKPEPKSTKLVIDDTTIYEIDLDCYECRKKKHIRYSTNLNVRQLNKAA